MTRAIVRSLLLCSASGAVSSGADDPQAVISRLQAAVMTVRADVPLTPTEHQGLLRDSGAVGGEAVFSELAHLLDALGDADRRCWEAGVLDTPSFGYQTCLVAHCLWKLDRDRAVALATDVVKDRIAKPVQSVAMMRILARRMSTSILAEVEQWAAEMEAVFSDKDGRYELLHELPMAVGAAFRVDGIARRSERCATVEEQVDWLLEVSFRGRDWIDEEVWKACDEAGAAVRPAANLDWVRPCDADVYAARSAVAELSATVPDAVRAGLERQRFKFPFTLHDGEGVELKLDLDGLTRAKMLAILRWHGVREEAIPKED